MKEGTVSFGETSVNPCYGAEIKRTLTALRFARLNPLLSNKGTHWANSRGKAQINPVLA